MRDRHPPLSERMERIKAATKIESCDYASPCWLFQGRLNHHGYAYAKINRRWVSLHRAFYEFCVGPIPSGMQVDHLCRNRACVNPEHLEAVTAQVNQRRGYSFSGINARKTHCPQGHPYDEANTRVSRSGKRHCRACARERARTEESRERNRDRMRAVRLGMPEGDTP